MISLIVAVSANGVIGSDGALPWHLPDDFKHFKAVTTGKPVIMGRKTFESIGKALPDRLNIVLTRSNNFSADGVSVAASPESALALAGDAAEIMIIGGSEIYALFLPMAGRVYLTRVDAVVDGDTVFPVLGEEDWAVVSSESHDADERHAFAFRIDVLERRS